MALDAIIAFASGIEQASIHKNTGEFGRSRAAGRSLSIDLSTY
jgi:hypothetical protein